MIVCNLKTRESQLALINELIAQLDTRVEYLMRQKNIFNMCKQDTTRINELLLSVYESFVKTRGFKEKLQADLTSNNTPE